MRRSFGEVLMTVGAITLLLLLLALADDRVRQHLTGRVLAQPSAEAATLVARAQSGARMVAEVVRSESRTHTPVVVFTIAATILVVFMLRT
jgi:hypothetical protein